MVCQSPVLVIAPGIKSSKNFQLNRKKKKLLEDKDLLPLRVLLSVFPLSVTVLLKCSFKCFL